MSSVIINIQPHINVQPVEKGVLFELVCVIMYSHLPMHMLY